MTYDEKLWILRNHLREGYIPNPEQFELQQTIWECLECGYEFEYHPVCPICGCEETWQKEGY